MRPGTALGIFLGSTTEAAQPEAEALADRYNCLMCHRVEARHVGPAFNEVARRYKDDPRALLRWVLERAWNL